MPKYYELYELLERPLNNGDFVLELTEYAYGDKSYGIVVDPKQIYTLNGLKSVKKVYKIENPVEKELLIYTNIIQSYNKYQNSLLQKTVLNGNYNRGDIIYKEDKWSTKYFLYLGEVYVEVYYKSEVVKKKQGYGYIYIDTHYSQYTLPNFELMTLNDLFGKITITKDWTGKLGEFMVLNKKSDKYIKSDYSLGSGIDNDIYMNYCATDLHVMLK